MHIAVVLLHEGWWDTQFSLSGNLLAEHDHQTRNKRSLQWTRPENLTGRSPRSREGYEWTDDAPLASSQIGLQLGQGRRT